MGGVWNQSAHNTVRAKHEPRDMSRFNVWPEAQLQPATNCLFNQRLNQHRTNDLYCGATHSRLLVRAFAKFHVQYILEISVTAFNAGESSLCQLCAYL